MASTRVYVHASVSDEFLSLFKEKIRQIRGKTGNPLLADTNSGPQADRQQFNVVKGFLAEAKQASYQFVLGEVPADDVGCFIEPVVIWDPPKDSDILNKEVFG